MGWREYAAERQSGTFQDATAPQAGPDPVHFAFTKPNAQFRRRVRPSLLQRLNGSSLYRRLMLQAAGEHGAQFHRVAASIARLLRSPSPKAGSQLLQFLYGQLYNGKLAKRYGHQDTENCPLCGHPDSCTHLAGACGHVRMRGYYIARHNTAVRALRDLIRDSAKGGAALWSNPVLAACDAGLQALDIREEDSGDDPSPSPHGATAADPDVPTWTPSPDTRGRDVTVDLKEAATAPPPAQGDARGSQPAEGVQAPRYLPEWVVPAADLRQLTDSQQGTAPDLVYAFGVPDVADPGAAPPFDKQQCALLLIEVGFAADLRLPARAQEKADKYQPLVDLLRRSWGRVELVTVPIGHAGTILTRTLDTLARSLSRWHPGRAPAPRGARGGAAPDAEAGPDGGEDVDPRAHKEMRRAVTQFADKAARLAADTLISMIRLRYKLARDIKHKTEDTTSSKRPRRQADDVHNRRPAGRPPPHLIDAVS